jgi:hypothetical protein
MTEDEFNAWMFPPVLTWQRKLVIRCIMLALTFFAAWVGQIPQ